VQKLGGLAITHTLSRIAHLLPAFADAELFRQGVQAVIRLLIVHQSHDQAVVGDQRTLRNTVLIWQS